MQNKPWINLLPTAVLMLPLAGMAMADERKDLALR